VQGASLHVSRKWFGVGALPQLTQEKSTVPPVPLWFLPRCMECRRGIAMRILSACHVRPSVCLSVKRVDCDKTEDRSVQIFIPYERSFSLVFWEEEWLVGATPSTWNFGSTGPVGAKSPIFNRYSSSVNTNRKSTTSFPMSIRWSSSLLLSPQRGAQNTKRPFYVYNRTSLKESLLQSFLV